MKRCLIAFLLVAVCAVSARAQTGGATQAPPPAQPMQGAQMMGQELMMRDMLLLMTGMLRTQQRMLKGLSADEKQALIDETTRMIERAEGIMSSMSGMMQGGMMASSQAGQAAAQTPADTVQERAEAGVTVKVSLEGKDGILAFKIVLDTHSVELDAYRFEDIIVLRADGKEYKGSVKSQEGSGHHRSAMVEFENPGAKTMEVIIRDVAGVNERTFSFGP